MSEVKYEIVEHDGGWAYKLNDVFSETFPTHQAALRGEPRALRERAEHDAAAEQQDHAPLDARRFAPLERRPIGATGQHEQQAAAEQRVPGSSETIEYEDERGKWHTERAEGSDRPQTDVVDKP